MQINHFAHRAQQSLFSKAERLPAQSNNIRAANKSNVDIRNNVNLEANRLPEGSTGPVLASSHARFLADLKPGDVRTFLIPNINIDNREVSKSTPIGDIRPVIAFYAHQGDHIKLTLKQLQGASFTSFATTIKLPLNARTAWPHVEIARTKGNQVIVVDDLSQKLRAILHSISGTSKFTSPRTGQVILEVNNLNPKETPVIPSNVNSIPAKYNPQKIITQAVIPSAGLGTRLQPYAQCKPLVELAAGKSLIEFLVENCLNQGIKRILIPVHKEMEEQFENTLKNYIKAGQVQLLPESLSGDAGGLLRYLKNVKNVAKPFINPNEPLLQVFGDAVTGLNINRIAKKWELSRTTNEDAPFVSIITRQYPTNQVDVLKKYGFTLTRSGSQDGPIEQLIEKPGTFETVIEQGGQFGKSAIRSGQMSIQAGMSILSPEFLKWMSKGTPGFSQENIVNFGQIFFDLLGQGYNFNALNMKEAWIDGGNGLDLNKGRAAILKGEIPSSSTKSELSTNIAEGYEGVFFSRGTREIATNWIQPFKGNATIQKIN